MENMGPMQDKRHSSPNMQALYHAAERLLVTCSLRDRLRVIMDCVRECLGWDRGWLGLVDKGQGVLRGQAYFGENVPPKYAIHEIPLDRGLRNPAIVSVFKKGAVIVNDPLSDPRCRDCREELIALGTKCFVNVPIILRGDVIGVIGADRVGERFDFADDDVKLLTAFANLAASAIENARLYDEAKELSLADDLTGLRNIRFFRGQLRRDLARASRAQQPLSVALLDIDNLKAVNDRFGHRAGDALLTEIGYRVRASLRSSDVVARYGGDEFLILFYGIDSKSACIPARRCLESIQWLAPVGHEMKVTASVGIASYPADASGEEELLYEADALCYKAKRAGGNRIWTANTSDQETCR